MKMPATSWKLISLVSIVQVLSEGVFFAQGILGSDDSNSTTNVKFSSAKELDWVQICVPIFYAATRQISEPCWRWIVGSYGNRMTTALGILTITVSIVTGLSQEIIAENAVYITLGGIGMGLVRLQIKSMKFSSGDSEWPLWGAGISGIGLSLWPLLACLCVRGVGSRYATLIFSAITLHAVPLALLAVRPKEKERDSENDANTRSTSPSPEVPFVNSEEDDGLTYELMDYNSYRIRPSYYVEVLPGIPEEVEHESDHERDGEMQRADSQAEETVGIYSQGIREREESSERDERGKKSGKIKIKVPTIKGLSLKTQGIEPKPFAYTVFVATVLLRLGDQLGVTIVISLLPVFAECLMPNLRLQEKAFLISLCGFSRILAEFPLLAFHVKSRKTKVVFLSGPIFAALGLYLIWNSATLDAMTLASFILGIGSGAASVTLQVFAPRESPRVCDAADVLVGVSLLATIPLTRIFILGHANQGCLLLAAVIYVVAAITAVFNLRKTA